MFCAAAAAAAAAAAGATGVPGAVIDSPPGVIERAGADVPSADKFGVEREFAAEDAAKDELAWLLLLAEAGRPPPFLDDNAAPATNCPVSSMPISTLWHGLTGRPNVSDGLCVVFRLAMVAKSEKRSSRRILLRTLFSDILHRLASSLAAWNGIHSPGTPGRCGMPFSPVGGTR